MRTASYLRVAGNRRVSSAVQAIALFALTLSVAVGCGDSRSLHPTSGRVVFPDGQPLTGGWVEMESIAGEEKTNPRGPIQPDGTFELGTVQPGDGVSPGRYRVLVSPPPPEGDPDEMAKKPVPPLIHQRFTRYETSGIEFTVDPDTPTNELNVTVERPSR